MGAQRRATTGKHRQAELDGAPKDLPIAERCPMNVPALPGLIVQRFVDRRHLYSAVVITAHFFDKANASNLPSRSGTGFLVNWKRTSFYVITNHHVLDYNYRARQGDVVRSAALASLEIRGYMQPEDQSQPAIPWTYTHETPDITFHPDDAFDLAVIRLPGVGEAPTQPGIKQPQVVCEIRWSPNGNFGEEWLATGPEINGLMPGEQIFIAGYPAVDGATDRPLMVNGIISSDPRYPAAFGNTDLGDVVLCHSFSWGGMSGAPVFGFSESIGRSKVIGVNAGHIAAQGISGGVISHFVKSSALIDLIEHVEQRGEHLWRQPDQR